MESKKPVPCLQQADRAHGIFGGRGVVFFSPFPSEQEHLCLKLRKQQGSAHCNSLTQLSGQPQAKMPGRGCRSSLGGFPPVPEFFLLALLLRLPSYWGLGMDNTGLQKEIRRVP